MKYRLISTDLDGTLLDASESISETNSEIMCALSKKGIIIAANTGRTLYEIPDSVRENPYIDYYICSNGAAIYDRDKKLVYSRYISEKDEREIFGLLRQYDTSFAVHDRGVSVLCERNSNVDFWVDHRASEYAARNFVRFSEVDKDFDARYSKGREIEMICCYFKHASELCECTERLSKFESVRTAASSGENIEIFSSDVDKGKTLVTLCDMLGIEKAEVIAAGDSQNDVTMLESAGLALAVANARELVKAAADRVICASTEHIMTDILKIITETDNG